MASLLDVLASATNGIAQANSSIRDIRSVGNQIENKINQAKRDPLSFISDLVRGQAFGTSDLANPIVGINSRGDAIQNWCWYCELPTLTETPLMPANVDLPWYYVPQASIPYRNIASSQTSRSGGQRNYPDSYSVDDLTLTLFMDDTNAAMDYANSWIGRVLSPDDPSIVTNRGLWGLPGHYKKEVKIHILTPAKDRLLTIKYVGCWPVTINQQELSSDSSSTLVAQIQLKVDDVYVEISDGLDQSSARFPFLGTTGFSLGSLSFKNLPNFQKLASRFPKLSI